MRRKFFDQVIAAAAAFLFAPSALATSQYPPAERDQVLGAWVAYIRPNFYYLELADDGSGFFARSSVYGSFELFRVVGWKLYNNTFLEIPLGPIDPAGAAPRLQVSGRASRAYQGRIVAEVKETNSPRSDQVTMYREAEFATLAESARAKIDAIRKKAR